MHLNWECTYSIVTNWGEKKGTQYQTELVLQNTCKTLLMSRTQSIQKIIHFFFNFHFHKQLKTFLYECHWRSSNRKKFETYTIHLFTCPKDKISKSSLFLVLFKYNQFTCLALWNILSQSLRVWSGKNFDLRTSFADLWNFTPNLSHAVLGKNT